MKKENIYGEKEKLLDFRKMAAIIKKNFIVIGRDNARILPLILFPVFMIMIFGYTSGNTPKHIPAAIIAYDHSPSSQRIQQEISKSNILSVRKVLSTEGEGRKLLDASEVEVLVIIPDKLQEKLDNGQTAELILTVDESDSAVASIARQTISAITNSLSKELAVEKTVSFQKSVEISSQKLQNSNHLTNQYSLIISRIDKSNLALEEADDIVSSQADTLESSLSPPAPVVAQEIRPGENVTSSNQTYVPETPEYLSAKAQIASLRKSSGLIEGAEAGLGSAKETAGQENAKPQENANYGNIAAAKDITKFTGYTPNGLVQPLKFVEKPAYGTGKENIDFIIPSIIALTIFQGAVMGMGRAVAGEKRDGSLTRVFLTPTSNVTIILGTLLFYIIFEIFRSSFLILLAMNLFHVKIEGSLLAVFAILIVYAGVSTAIGMFISSLVKTEQQYFGMAMLVSMPTIFLAGAFFPIQAMPKFLQALAAFLPVTYAGDALRGVMTKGFSIITIFNDIFALLIFLAVTLGACFLVFKRDIE